MRIVQARKRVWEVDHIFENKFSLLVWILSLLKWKEYGNQLVLYTDTETLARMKDFDIARLYDEINTELFDFGSLFEDIDLEYFWAMPKIAALHHESHVLGNNVMVVDQDVVPMTDISRLLNLANVTVWSNKEFIEDRGAYPKLYNLSLPDGYELPEWFTGKVSPLNTGVIYFKDKACAVEYCNEVFKYVRRNKNKKQNSRCGTMCTAEQRMIGEYVKYKGFSYMTIQPINEGLFNKNAFHTHGYKNVIDDDINWCCKLLQIIHEADASVYDRLINHEFFAREKVELSLGAIYNVKQLSIY